MVNEETHFHTHSYHTLSILLSSCPHADAFKELPLSLSLLHSQWETPLEAFVVLPWITNSNIDI